MNRQTHKLLTGFTGKFCILCCEITLCLLLVPGALKSRNMMPFSYLPIEIAKIKPREILSHNVKLMAYEVKNNCCLFERLFKVKKNGVFLLGIYFFIFRDIYVFVLCK